MEYVNIAARIVLFALLITQVFSSGDQDACNRTPDART